MPRLHVAVTLIFALVLTGCATIMTRNGISSASLAETAEIPGMPGVRFWGDEVPKDPIAEIRRRTAHMPKLGKNTRTVAGRKVVDTLALSGGGSDGAFGAGVLAGWTKRGDRPEFQVVTGVSAGAIIAPFAFLGPSEDEKLHAIWTQYKQDQVATPEILSGLFGGPALSSTAPLQNLIAHYVDEKFLDRIAAQYKRGRVLLVLTTNLDAQRPVVWNMGEIALKRSPQAIELFRKVILASAAIPAAFPPVKIEVVADGRMYDELHVDGGTTREVFISPVDAPIKAFDVLYDQPPIRRYFIIKNGKATPDQEVVKPTTLQIAGRSISTLIKSQNMGEVYHIYRVALDGGADFNFLAVPPSFDYKTKEIYDPKYQAALYAKGVQVGRSGIWLKHPPGVAPIGVDGQQPRPSLPEPVAAAGNG
ncbi:MULTISPECIES: patatin-like phospholipase family protein [unclassified Hyphomicrobium]|uniref:patatin-like phospholipase family protein n=1 Tax=unclassified Hyphomicrobium TaxID=2619925 RepID=UPI001FCC93B2|nr:MULTISPECIES: patatin-like phospholipase family protein [unclassified Hyphomicrobium]